MTVLLALAPLLALLVTLLAGHYVGEERIARLAAGRRPARRRAPAASIRPAPRRAPRGVPRGGRLISASMAMRGPPAVLVGP